MRRSTRKTLRLTVAGVLVATTAVIVAIDESAQAATAIKPTVSRAVAVGVSQPVRDLPHSDATDLSIPESVDENEGTLSHPTGDGSAAAVDPALQTGPAGSGIPPTAQNFEGVDVGDSSSDMVFVGAPPDTNGDVGPNHYVQTVNTVFAIWDKTGNRLVDPTPLDSLWLSAANNAEFNCTTQSRGDPVVQYDPMADRWVITQFNFPIADPVLGAAFVGPFDECIAVSTGPDPTSDYYLYDFTYSATVFNDYPHFGVWPDGYYMSVNQFDAANLYDFHSAGACAFEREKMLVGDTTARQVCFDESQFDPKDADGNYVYGGQLPTDLDGSGVGAAFDAPPPAGEPNTFLQFRDSTTAGEDELLAFRFKVNWADPASSTFGTGAPGGEGEPIHIPVADFDSMLCNGGNTRDCLPQKDSESGLDSIPDRLMYRAAYRNFGDHESIVINHTVSVGDSDKHAGVRWYELRDPAGTPTVYQQSTYAPDSENRWMGSIGMDRNGAIAVGYSLTSPERFASIAYTARNASDPLNQMTLGEGLLVEGTGAQDDTGNRWGDYSSMSLDPDGCTFWFTSEYYQSTGTFNWATRIGSFSLPSCGDPQVSLSSSVPSTPVRGDYTYTIAVNTGADAVRDAQVSDTLPSNVTLLSATSTTGSCTGTATVVCKLGDLPASDLEQIELTVHARRSGMADNVATLSTATADSNPDNNVARTSTLVADPCSVPGTVVATDPAGDQTGAPQQDVTSVAVAEPDSGATGDFVFTIKAASLSPQPPPSSYWYAYFTYEGRQFYVALDTTGPLSRNTSNPPISYKYGYFAVDSTTGLNTQHQLGAADSGTWSPDGTIAITVSRGKLDPDNTPDATTPTNGPKEPPTSGSQLTAVFGEARTLVGALIVRNDATANGSYTSVGGAYCAPNTAPSAALAVTPGSGIAPLAVTLDASGSSDADAGDSVSSYTFYFGDGSAPVTQSSPTVQHTYATPGSYHPTLTVRDSRGQESQNVGEAVVTAQSGGADVSVLVSGPGTARVGKAVSYQIVATNNGPQPASGVAVSNALPKAASVTSVSTTAGSCSASSKTQVVLCDLGALAPGSSVTITVTVKYKSTGPMTDTARISSTSPNDPVTENNTSSATTSVTR